MASKKKGEGKTIAITATAKGGSNKKASIKLKIKQLEESRIK